MLLFFKNMSVFVRSFFSGELFKKVGDQNGKKKEPLFKILPLDDGVPKSFTIDGTITVRTKLQNSKTGFIHQFEHSFDPDSFGPGPEGIEPDD